MADPNYRVIQRDDDSFAVEVTWTGALPQTAVGFATEAEADALDRGIFAPKRLLPLHPPP